MKVRCTCFAVILAMSCKTSPPESTSGGDSSGTDGQHADAGLTMSPAGDSAERVSTNETMASAVSATADRSSDVTVASTNVPASADSALPMDSGSSRDPSSGDTRRLPRFQIAAAESGTCAIDGRGRIHCWGDVAEAGRQWQVPDGEFTAIFARIGEMMCALDRDGVPKCFGFPETDARTRITMPISRLATGNVSCAVSVDGFGYCLEPPDDLIVKDPEGPYHRIPDGETVTEVDSGGSFACGLRASDGSVVCWGPLAHREREPSECTNTPWAGQTEPPSGSFVDLDVGQYTACALSGRGRLSCWGVGSLHDDPEALNCDERLNFGQAVPPGDDGFRQVSVGVHHACAIDVEGNVKCWGAGSQSGCSDGDCEQSLAPSGAFDQVAAGTYHTCAMRSDRTVACWGAPQSPSMRAVPEALLGVE